jgi:hypothetical protein
MQIYKIKNKISKILKLNHSTTRVGVPYHPVSRNGGKEIAIRRETNTIDKVGVFLERMVKLEWRASKEVDLRSNAGNFLFFQRMLKNIKSLGE